MQSSDELEDGATDDRIITDNVHCKSATAIGGERTVYSVDGIPGLQLRVSPADKQGNVAKVWTLRYRRPADNALKRFTIGPFPEVGLAAARQKAKELRRRA